MQLRVKRSIERLQIDFSNFTPFSLLNSYKLATGRQLHMFSIPLRASITGACARDTERPMDYIFTEQLLPPKQALYSNFHEIHHLLEHDVYEVDGADISRLIELIQHQTHNPHTSLLMRGSDEDFFVPIVSRDPLLEEEAEAFAEYMIYHLESQNRLSYLLDFISNNVLAAQFLNNLVGG